MEYRFAHLAITLDNGDLNLMQFITTGRGDKLPSGATWFRGLADGWWYRSVTDENVEDELRRTYATADQFGQRIDRPMPVKWERLPNDAIPTDRTYRAAWRCEAGVITHDMAHVRGIALARLREKRNAALDRLDRDFMRALGQGKTDETARVEEKRQALRDLPAVVTPRLLAATTIEELNAALPPVAG